MSAVAEHLAAVWTGKTVKERCCVWAASRPVVDLAESLVGLPVDMCILQQTKDACFIGMELPAWTAALLVSCMRLLVDCTQ